MVNTLHNSLYKSTSPNAADLQNSPNTYSRSPFLYTRTNKSIVISSPNTHNHNVDPLTNSEYAEEVVDLIRNEEQSRWLYGLFAIFITIATWVVATQLANGAIKNEGYNQPLLAAYLNGSCFIIYGFPEVWKKIKQQFLKQKHRIFGSGSNVSDIESNNLLHRHNNNNRNYGSVKDFNNIDENLSLDNTNINDDNFTALSRSIGSLNSLDYETNQLEDIIMTDSKIFQTPMVRLTSREIKNLALKSCLVYIGNSVCGTMSLRFTSSANQTILFTTTSLFTLFLGYFNKVEKFTIAKLLAVVVSISGIICITVSDKQNDPNLPGLVLFNSDYKISVQQPVIGDMIAMLGALLYACYLIILKIGLGSETDSKSDKVVFSYIGLFTLVLGLPILLVAHFTGFERFTHVDSPTIYIIIFASGLLNCISDYFSIIASLLTSPFITALSLTAAIPISMICDSLFYHVNNSSVLYYLGIIFIFSSFIFTNMTGEEEIIKEAVEEAIEEALEHNELLSPLLSPYLEAQTPHLKHIPQLDQLTNQIETPGSIVSASTSHNTQHQIVVTGGANHKYYIRELNNL